jgi:hypothetical protein
MAVKYVRELKSKQKPYVLVDDGEIFDYQGDRYLFLRWKRGMASIEAKKVSNEKVYSLKINDRYQETNIIGYANEEEYIPNDIESIKEGDLFALTCENKIEIYRLLKNMVSKVKAENPVTKEIVEFEKDRKFIKIENLVGCTI